MISQPPVIHSIYLSSGVEGSTDNFSFEEFCQSQEWNLEFILSVLHGCKYGALYNDSSLSDGVACFYTISNTTLLHNQILELLADSPVEFTALETAALKEIADQLVLHP